MTESSEESPVESLALSKAEPGPVPGSGILPELLQNCKGYTVDTDAGQCVVFTELDSSSDSDDPPELTSCKIKKEISESDSDCELDEPCLNQIEVQERSQEDERLVEFDSDDRTGPTASKNEKEVSDNACDELDHSALEQPNQVRVKEEPEAELPEFNELHVELVVERRVKEETPSTSDFRRKVCEEEIDQARDGENQVEHLPDLADTGAGLAGHVGPKKLFKCRHCNLFWDHLRIEHHEAHCKGIIFTVDEYKCENCGSKFKRKVNLTRHQSSFECEKRLKCCRCDTTYKFSGSFEENCEEHKKNCDAKLANDRGEKRFVQVYQCRTCQEIFEGLVEFRKHKRLHLSKPLKCSFCEKTFVYKHQQVIHERVHTGEKPYECPMCDKAFARKANLGMHERNYHLDVKAHGCRFCDKMFKHKAQAVQHERTHTGEKPYKCHFCEKCFANCSSRAAHERSHTGVKPYECRYCDKAFVQCSNLKSHEVRHLNAKKEFRASRKKNPELFVHHCQYCEATFSNRNSRWKHEVVHRGGQRYACRYCDKMFVEKEQQLVHERVHTGETPFKCQTCDKAFKQRSGLMSHKRIHKKEKS